MMKRILKWPGAAIGILVIFAVGIATTEIISAYLSVSKALEEVPPELLPPPQAFSRIAKCVNPNGLDHVVARRLLEREGLTRVRSTRWNLRFLSWTIAVGQRNADEVLGLYASVIQSRNRPQSDSTENLKSKVRDESWNAAAMLEDAVLDSFPSASSQESRQSLRAKCAMDAA